MFAKFKSICARMMRCFGFQGGRPSGFGFCTCFILGHAFPQFDVVLACRGFRVVLVSVSLVFRAFPYI